MGTGEKCYTFLRVTQKYDVEKGIEKFSSIVMPWLLVMIVGIGIFSLTLRHDGRTGLQGLGST